MNYDELFREAAWWGYRAPKDEESAECGSPETKELMEEIEGAKAEIIVN